jgi:hypothetical protein
MALGIEMSMVSFDSPCHFGYYTTRLELVIIHFVCQKTNFLKSKKSGFVSPKNFGQNVMINMKQVFLDPPFKCGSFGICVVLKSSNKYADPKK